MSKPEDIPQDVWEAAVGSFDPSITPATPDTLLETIYTLIARAILAERQRHQSAMDSTHVRPLDMWEAMDPAIRNGGA